MTESIDRLVPQTRRAAMAKARLSRRPSRLGDQAGAAEQPTYLIAADAGFPGLLKRTWQRAVEAPDLPSAVQALLTLDGHVPPDIALRSLPVAQECALQVLVGLTWRDSGERPTATAPDDERPAFVGEIGLSTDGRLEIRVPAVGPLSTATDLVGGILRVRWSRSQVTEYQDTLDRATARFRESTDDCRQWLAAAGEPGRRELLDTLKEAARRTAPFVLYADCQRYTNFRDRNTLTGKTLWPGHPDCALSSLEHLPPQLWTAGDVQLVVGLTALVRSAGFGRIEEANGTQVSVDHIAHLLNRVRATYQDIVAPPWLDPPVLPADASTHQLLEFAEAVRRRRTELSGPVQLFREIHGPLLHKVERVAAAAAEPARRRETALCATLSDRLPVSGTTLAELTANLRAAPEWLARPYGDYGTGLEYLIHETVSAATTGFNADFAMSRGMRSLPALLTALREQQWQLIASWDMPNFFCCVVPAPHAAAYFGDSRAHLADVAWSISARMHYNSWHFLVANLPKVPEIVARDYFVAPTIPDIAYFSDQHHHGHIAARVRFSIRSPQPVRILGHELHGFVDLRLLRCEGTPFNEQDLLAAQLTSAFIATATGLAADLVQAGEEIEVTAFDSEWHWARIAG